MHRANQELQNRLERAIKDGDLVRAYYLEEVIVDPTQVMKGQLVLETWMLKNEL